MCYPAINAGQATTEAKSGRPALNHPIKNFYEIKFLFCGYFIRKLAPQQISSLSNLIFK